MPRTTQEITLEIAQKQELLRIYRGNLHDLQVKKAKQGIDVSTSITNQITDTEKEIRVLDEAIAFLEVELAQIARTESEADREKQLIGALLEQRNGVEGIKTDHPVALAICLTSLGSIKIEVKLFLERQGLPMDIDELTMAGINSSNDIARFVVALQQKKRTFQEQGYTEVHLFMAGPIIAGVLVGGIFDNWKPVKLYHKAGNTATQSYEYWMPLIGT